MAEPRRPRTNGSEARGSPAGTAGLFIVDLEGLTSPDLGTVDLMARVQLAARRCGTFLVFEGTCRELLDLLELAGLGSVVDARGQAEQGEPPLGVQEEDDPGDLPVG